jgi:biopolymer transport protein ExbB/TolQ
MNTTAFGLMSAIPLLLFHAMLQTKTTEIVDSLEMAGVKCLNIISGAGVAADKAQLSKSSRQGA